VVANFVAPLPTTEPAPPRARWLCVARLTPEKGVLEMVRSWPRDVELDIVGEGELRDAIEAEAPAGVHLIGSFDNATLRAAMRRYAGLVVPSRWFEGLPTVYLEALASGVPVVAFDGNSAADDVLAHDLGIVTSSSPDAEELAAALTGVAGRGEELRRRCAESFAARFTPPVWVEAITALYTGTGTAPTGARVAGSRLAGLNP
jgi:glycosyltransferase involved in cell wall biosynthesis